MSEKKYVVCYRFSTQVGIDQWAQVQTFLECPGETTLGEIREWMDSKAVSTPISLTLSELEQLEPKNPDTTGNLFDEDDQPSSCD